MIAEPNFLTDLKVDQMPENFPERCGLAKESNEITLGKNFVRANYQFLMEQSKDANSQDSIARMLVKVVEKQLKLHKHETIQLERSEAVDTELAVVALGHTNSIGHASGRMGVMAGDIKDTQDNTEILESITKDLQNAIRALVSFSTTSHFFKGCHKNDGGIVFGRPKGGEFVVAPNEGESGSDDRSPHADTLGTSFEIDREFCEPMYTAVIGVTSGPSTKISNHILNEGTSPITILQEDGHVAFGKLFEGLECVDKFLPPLTITIFPSNVIHAGAQGSKDFLCPYTQSTNRITYTFFFSPAIFAGLQSHDGIDVFKGVGAGIHDMIKYDISSISHSLLSRAGAFTAACVDHTNRKDKKKTSKRSKQQRWFQFA